MNDFLSSWRSLWATGPFTTSKPDPGQTPSVGLSDGRVVPARHLALVQQRRILRAVDDHRDDIAAHSPLARLGVLLGNENAR